MTQPNYLPYQTPDPAGPDRSNLNVLSILHYVWGGLTVLFSCFGIIYIVLGIMFLSGNSQLNRAFTPPSGSTTATTGPTSVTPPPPQLGYLFAGMGSCITLFGWAIGILTIISGRRIAQRRGRVFSFVMAGINCMSFPFGTGLGVFTFIMLSKDSVKAQYPQSN